MDGANAPLEDRTLHERVGLDQVLDLQDVLEGLAVGGPKRCLEAALALPDLRVDLRVRAVDELGVPYAGGLVLVQVGGRQLRLGLTTGINRHRAAWRERTARRQVQQGGRVALDRGQRLVLVKVRTRQGSQQTDGVRVTGAIEQLVDVGPLDDATGIHDGHPVGKASHDTEVVGDHDDTGVGLTLSHPQQIENLRLDGHVESRRRLVCDDEIGAMTTR